MNNKKSEPKNHAQNSNLNNKKQSEQNKCEQTSQPEQHTNMNIQRQR